MTSFDDPSKDQPRDASGQFAATATSPTDENVLDVATDHAAHEEHRLMVNRRLDTLDEEEEELYGQLEDVREKRYPVYAYGIAAECRSRFPSATKVVLEDMDEANGDGSWDMHPTDVLDADGNVLGEYDGGTYTIGVPRQQDTQGDHGRGITKWDWARDPDGNLDLATINARAATEIYGKK